MNTARRIIGVIYGLTRGLFQFGKKALTEFILALPFAKKPTLRNVVKSSAKKIIPLSKFNFHLN